MHGIWFLRCYQESSHFWAWRRLKLCAVSALVTTTLICTYFIKAGELVCNFLGLVRSNDINLWVVNGKFFQRVFGPAKKVLENEKFKRKEPHWLKNIFEQNNLFKWSMILKEKWSYCKRSAIDSRFSGDNFSNSSQIFRRLTSQWSKLLIKKD